MNVHFESDEYIYYRNNSRLQHLEESVRPPPSLSLLYCCSSFKISDSLDRRNRTETVN